MKPSQNLSFRSQTLVSVLLTTSFALAFFSFAPISEPNQVLIVLVFAGIIGVPHGLTDFFLLYSLGRNWSRTALYALLYLVFFLLCFQFWDYSPLLSLLVFLAAAWWHFGQQDCVANQTDEPLLILYLGSIPILVPYLAHPQTAQYYSQMIGMTLPAVPIEVGVLGILILCVGAVVIFVQWRRLLLSLELSLMLLIFSLLPPLLSFTLYFCLWHTPRLYIEALRATSLPAERSFIKIFIAFSMFLLPVGFLWMAQSYSALTFEKEGVLFFQVLASLTIAHVSLTFISMKQQSSFSRGNVSQ